MAYTPIEWDEITPITPTNLNKMDNQINDNEDDLRTIQDGEVAVDGRITTNEGDISNHEGRITTNEGFIGGVKWNSGRYAGNNETDRQINVGFEPDIVIIAVTGNSDFYGTFRSTETNTGFLVTKNHNAGANSNPIKITSNGFNLGGYVTHNYSGRYYQWAAVKLGN